MTVFEELKKSKILDLSAQLAFYFLLMLVPFLLFSITLLGYLPISAKNAVYIVTDVLPDKSSQLVESSIRNVLEQKKGALFLLLLSFISASNGVHGTIRALNEAYRIKETRSYWKVRLISLLFTLLMMIAILIQLLVPILGQMIIDGLELFIPFVWNGLLFLEKIKWMIGFVVVFIIVLGLYGYGPNHTLKIGDVWFGAFVTATGWQLVSTGFAYYLSHFGSLNLAYGTLGVLIVLMVWFYCIGFILVLGGEINAFVSRKKKISSLES